MKQVMKKAKNALIVEQDFVNEIDVHPAHKSMPAMLSQNNMMNPQRNVMNDSQIRLM